MSNFLIQCEELQTVNELEKHGEVFYKSTIMKIVGLKTDTDKSQLMRIKGVISVEKDRRGRNHAV